MAIQSQQQQQHGPIKSIKNSFISRWVVVYCNNNSGAATKSHLDPPHGTIFGKHWFRGQLMKADKSVRYVSVMDDATDF